MTPADRTGWKGKRGEGGGAGDGVMKRKRGGKEEEEFYGREPGRYGLHQVIKVNIDSDQSCRQHVP